MKVHYISELIGNTPCIFLGAKRDSTHLYLKLEGYNPTGSVKDRACYYMIKSARERGMIRPGMTLLDASGGRFAASMAYFGRLFGHPVEVVVNSRLTAETERFIEYFCGKMIRIGDFTIEGNRFCRRIAETDRANKYCFLDQLHNWDNPEAYYQGLGPEILSDLPGVSAVVGSLASGGTMMGVGKYLKERNSGIKVIVVQAAYGSFIPGIGSFDHGDYATPFIKRGLEQGIFDTVIKVDHRSAVEKVRQLRDKGIFCGLQTGGVIHAAQTVIAGNEVGGEVIAIGGDSGWRSMEKLYMLV